MHVVLQREAGSDYSCSSKATVLGEEREQLCAKTKESGAARMESSVPSTHRIARYLRLPDCSGGTDFHTKSLWWKYIGLGLKGTCHRGAPSLR